MAKNGKIGDKNGPQNAIFGKIKVKTSKTKKKGSYALKTKSTK